MARMDSANSLPEPMWTAIDYIQAIPMWIWTFVTLVALLGISVLASVFALILLAPIPRPPRKSEKQFRTINPNGAVSSPQPLSSWYDNYVALKEMADKGMISADEAYQITEAELFMTLVVPAYNEQERLPGMLEEAVEYLQEHYGHHDTKSSKSSNGGLQATGAQGDPWRGWEILIVSDGSTDDTIATALNFARAHQLGKPAASKGPWIGNYGKPTTILPGSIRAIHLEVNRGKGGAVVHGMRHARGKYIIFADADGASKFSDLGKLVAECERVKDSRDRAVGIGSRAYMVGTDAVVKRSFLRNTLMRSFHLLLKWLTTAKTSQIGDTQCGFKLFTRASLPYIVPFMHSQGWIFDVEMLMLAEAAGIPMVEVPIGWKEVGGSKLNVIWDSIGMATGLARLRICWVLGLYKRD